MERALERRRRGNARAQSHDVGRLILRDEDLGFAVRSQDGRWISRRRGVRAMVLDEQHECRAKDEDDPE